MHVARLVGLFLAVALAAFGSACSPKLDWREFHAGDGGFTVLLPQKPGQAEHSFVTPLGPITMKMYSVRIDETVLGAGYADFAGPVDAHALDLMRDALVRGLNGTLAGEKPVAAGTLSGREIIIAGAPGRAARRRRLRCAPACTAATSVTSNWCWREKRARSPRLTPTCFSIPFTSIDGTFWPGSGPTSSFRSRPMSQPPTLLIVDPAHYDVSYAINPWMQPDAWARDPQGMRDAALRASQALRMALEGAGCKVEVAAGAPGLPDMVFPANAAVVLDGRALTARFRHPQRRGEEEHFLAIFLHLREQGLLEEVEQLPEGCFQEGAGDCIWDAARGHFWGGYGPRSRRESIDAMAEFFGPEIVPLELVSDRCYHLDVGFCPLSGGEILYFPPALSSAALRALHERVPPELRIEASEEDLRHFSVNAVSVGRTIVMNRTTVRLRDELTRRGYSVSEVDLAPFVLSGGGAFCMTLRLDCSSAGDPTVAG